MNSQNVESKVLKTELIEWRKLKFIQDDNFKEWIGNGDEKLMRSILKYQFIDPFKVWEHQGDIYCLDGKHRTLKLEKAHESGVIVPDLLPATFIECTDIKQAAELVLVYSSAYARITNDGLTEFISKFDLSFPDLQETLAITDFDMISFESAFGNNTGETKDVISKSLQEQFIIPPFSVLDTRQGYWQKRKQLWHSLGFDSQETREDVELIAQSGQSSAVYELRNKQGFYKNFVSDTIEAFETAGAKFYNEMILINVAGSLPIRVGQEFKSGRKVGKMHQNVLVFYKGDPKKIKEEFPEIKVGEYLDELNDNPNIALSVTS